MGFSPNSTIRRRARIGLALALSLETAAGPTRAWAAEARFWDGRRAAVDVRPPEFSRPAFPSIPRQLASVQVVSGVEDATAPVVFLIDDIHLHEKAQESIGRLISHLLASGAGLLALEGAFEPIPVSPAREYPNQAAVRQSLDYLRRTNRLSGALHAALTTRGVLPHVVGVDDRSLYEANIQAYLAARPLQERLKTQWHHRRAEAAETLLATAGPELRAFVTAREEHAAGRLRFADYLRRLAAWIPPGAESDRFLEAYRLEREVDFDAVRAALARASGRDGRAQVPDRRLIGRFGRYVELSRSIDAARLMSEISRAEASIGRALARTEAQRSALRALRRAELIQKLVSFSLTRDDWDAYRVETAGGELDAFERFYASAQDRDRRMADNLVDAVRRRGERRSVLVAGGFHSRGVSQHLRDAGFSVVRLRPRFSADAGEPAAYLSEFAREKTPLDRLFEAEHLFVTPKVWDRSHGPLLSMIFWLCGAHRGHRPTRDGLSPWLGDIGWTPDAGRAGKKTAWVEFGPHRLEGSFEGDRLRDVRPSPGTWAYFLRFFGETRIVMPRMTPETLALFAAAEGVIGGAMISYAPATLAWIGISVPAPIAYLIGFSAWLGLNMLIHFFGVLGQDVNGDWEYLSAIPRPNALGRDERERFLNLWLKANLVSTLAFPGVIVAVIGGPLILVIVAAALPLIITNYLIGKGAEIYRRRRGKPWIIHAALLDEPELAEPPRDPLVVAPGQENLIPVYDSKTQERLGLLGDRDILATGAFRKSVQALVYVRDRDGSLRLVLPTGSSDAADFSELSIDQPLRAGDREDADAALRRSLELAYGLSGEQIGATSRINGDKWIRIYREVDGGYSHSFASIYLVEAKPTDAQRASMRLVDWRALERSPGEPEPQGLLQLYMNQGELATHLRLAVSEFMQGRPPPAWPYRRACLGLSPTSSYSLWMTPQGRTLVHINGRDGVEGYDAPVFDLVDPRPGERLKPLIRYMTRDGQMHIWGDDEQLERRPARPDAASLDHLADIYRRFNLELNYLFRSANARERVLLQRMRFKFDHALKTLWARIHFGDVIIAPPDSPAPTDLPQVTIALPAAFDPPELHHISLLLDSLTRISEHRIGTPTIYRLALIPGRDRAPVPSDATDTAAFDHRLDMSQRLSAVFSPLVQTYESIPSGPGSLFIVEDPAATPRDLDADRQLADALEMRSTPYRRIRFGAPPTLSGGPANLSDVLVIHDRLVIIGPDAAEREKKRVLVSRNVRNYIHRASLYGTQFPHPALVPDPEDRAFGSIFSGTPPLVFSAALWSRWFRLDPEVALRWPGPLVENFALAIIVAAFGPSSWVVWTAAAAMVPLRLARVYVFDAESNSWTIKSWNEVPRLLLAVSAAASLLTSAAVVLSMWWIPSEKWAIALGVVAGFILQRVLSAFFRAWRRVRIWRSGEVILADHVGLEEINAMGPGLDVRGLLFWAKAGSIQLWQGWDDAVWSADVHKLLEDETGSRGRTVLGWLQEFAAWTERMSHEVPADRRQPAPVSVDDGTSRRAFFAVNLTQGHGWEANTLAIWDGRLVTRTAGVGFHQKQFRPPHGPHWIMVFDPDKSGIYPLILNDAGEPIDVPIDPDEARAVAPQIRGLDGNLMDWIGRSDGHLFLFTPDGEKRNALPIESGFGGVPLLESGVSTLELSRMNNLTRDQRELREPRFNQRPAETGLDLGWATDQNRLAMTVFGFDAQGDLMILQVWGKQGDPREPTLAQIVDIARQVGFTAAILGGTSGDVQHWIKSEFFAFFDLPIPEWMRQGPSVNALTMGRRGSTFHERVKDVEEESRRLGHGGVLVFTEAAWTEITRRRDRARRRPNPPSRPTLLFSLGFLAFLVSEDPLVRFIGEFALVALGAAVTLDAVWRWIFVRGCDGTPWDDLAGGSPPRKDAAKRDDVRLGVSELFSAPGTPESPADRTVPAPVRFNRGAERRRHEAA